MNVWSQNDEEEPKEANLKAQEGPISSVFDGSPEKKEFKSFTGKMSHAGQMQETLISLENGRAETAALLKRKNESARNYGMLDDHLPESASTINCFVSKRVSDAPGLVKGERNDHYLGELAKEYQVPKSRKDKEILNFSSKKKEE